MGEPDGQIARIRAKLDLVRARGLQCFGSGGHQFLLEPPAAETRVRAFEVEHGITLPAGYRAFITQVGHGGPGSYGGAGPYYGLYALDEWDDFVTWISDEAPSDWLARPSPLRPGRNELPDFVEDDDEWPGEAVMNMYAGILSLGSRGCTYAMGLVVTGEARGRVVYLDADHSEPPYVGRDADFLDWYERWLDELLSGYEGSWFGYGPAGGEPELLAVILDSDDLALRVEAIHNLLKLPNLSEDVFTVLASRVSGAHPEERVASVGVFLRADAAQVAPLVDLLDDADADIRRASCRALMAADPDRWADAVKQLLREDTEPKVRTDAFFALKRASAFEEEELAELVELEHLGSIRSMCAELMDWRDRHDDLVRLLTASEVRLRRFAAGRVMAYEVEQARATALERYAIEDDGATRSFLIRYLARMGERQIVESLLQWFEGGDDFERLELARALIQLGDDRAVEPVAGLLALERPPRAPSRSHTKTFRQLLEDDLRHSPSSALRSLASVS